MCCFAGPVKDVHWTRIFARLTGKGTQLLAYQMSYESEQPNAMILPLPVKQSAGEQSVRFVDLSGYDRFFTDLKSGFPALRKTRSILPAAGIASNVALQVHKVGRFVASFVPTIDDFARLDPQFTIPRETWAQIPAYLDYGFAVFQLSELAGKPHPMAFEFETRLKETFFPTVHIHDGEVHAKEKFHHDLYMQHAGLDSVVGAYTGPQEPDRNTTLVRSKQAAEEFCDVERARGLVAPNLLVHRRTMRGRLPNEDTTFRSSGDPLVTGFNYRRYTRHWPWATCALAAAWFLKRRAQVRKDQS